MGDRHQLGLCRPALSLEASVRLDSQASANLRRGRIGVTPTLTSSLTSVVPVALQFHL